MAIRKLNAANERIKREYFIYLREAKRRNEASVDAVAKALSRFEAATEYVDFKKFHRDQAVKFKRKLDQAVSVRSGERLSRATVHSTLQGLKAFFLWLADRPGFKSRIQYADAEYFNLSEKDMRIAQARREKPFPTLEQFSRVLSMLPSGTDIERRDQALIAFTLLTGARDGALASIKLKHVDLPNRLVNQDAREVRTKFSKTFTTWFFPVEGPALAIVTEWVRYLLEILLWGGNDPLFPATRIAPGPNGGFQAEGLSRQCWTTAAPIRRIFREAFTLAGLPYFPPHSARNTLVLLGEQVCRTPEEFKAWSQNLGHEAVLTTFTSYGKVGPARQADIIRNLGRRDQENERTGIDGRLARIEAALKSPNITRMWE